MLLLELELFMKHEWACQFSEAAAAEAYEQFLAFALTNPASTLSQESKSEVRAHLLYAAMRIKTHLDNDLYQITSVCFEHEHELVIAEAELVSSPAW